jgi:dihydroorotase
VSLTLDRLVHPGLITLKRFIELLSINPARILNVKGGTLSEGQPADITVLAPDLGVTIDLAKTKSKSKNSPFGGWQLKGGVAATIVGGRLVYANDAVTSVREWRTQGAAV